VVNWDHLLRGCKSEWASAYSGLEPVDKLDNVRMLELLEHLQLIVNHLLVALDIALQDDLDGNLAIGAVGLTDDTIGAGTESSTESVQTPRLGQKCRVRHLNSIDGGSNGGGSGRILLIVALGLALKAVKHAVD
jgi:hypothetical protein